MQRLKELRKNKGLYQKDVASFFGIDRTTYVKWETGATNPDPEMLNKLASFFDVSIDYLLGRTDVKTTAGGEPMQKDERQRQFEELYERLNDEQRKLVISQMQWLLSKQE